MSWQEFLNKYGHKLPLVTFMMQRLNSANIPPAELVRYSEFLADLRAAAVCPPEFK